MTSLLVVDDHTLFREGMIALIGQWSEFRVVGQAEDGPTAVALAQELQPDIVLLDVNMPG
ncbi:MAG: response regulator, partial [Brooklawnia sp.]